MPAMLIPSILILHNLNIVNSSELENRLFLFLFNVISRQQQISFQYPRAIGYKASVKESPWAMLTASLIASLLFGLMLRKLQFSP